MRILKIFAMLLFIAVFSSTAYSGELKKKITAEVNGLNIFYTEKTTLSKQGFNLEKSKYLKDRGAYRLMVVNRFKQRYLKGPSLRAEGWKDVVFLDKDQILKIQCTVRGAITKTIGENVADFEWLLEPYNIDLFYFKKTSPKELSCYKKLNGIPVQFTLKFPSAFIGHCYFHVWYKQ